MSTAARRLVTEAEFLSLPESSERVELIDGEVIVAPSPSLWHQELVARFVQSLRAWAAQHDAAFTVAQAPLDVRLGSDRIVQPDAMVFSEALPMDTEGPVDRIPTICIEVLSANRAYDRVTKRFLYAQAGVREYLLVEPSGIVEQRTGDGLSEVEEVTDVLRSALLPGFEFDLRAAFQRR